MKIIHIPASREYDVCIARGLLDRVGELVAPLISGRKAVIVSDDRVASLYEKRVCTSLKQAGFQVVTFSFPNGEQSKNLSTLGSLLNFLAQHRLSRSDFLVALGGGVTGDLTGFAASIYLRGLPFIQIPTTLLAMVDSSVGGKTAVDLEAGKNLAGTFWQPSLVLCDPDTLDSLPEENFRDGCAEVIKYGILGNEVLFKSLLDMPAAQQIEAVIETCVTMKRDIVCKDEFDNGVRRLLNLGHSFGHAMEVCSDYTLTHGKAVAIGMATITRAGAAKGICSQETLRDVLAILRQYDLPSEPIGCREKLLSALLSDKKMGVGKLHLIVPEKIGSCRIEAVPAEEIAGWLEAGGIV